MEPIIMWSTPTGTNNYYKQFTEEHMEYQYPEQRSTSGRTYPRHIIDQQIKGATMTQETPVTEDAKDLIAEANEQSRAAFPATTELEAELSPDQSDQRRAQYESMITQLMTNQNISRGKAKRALEAHSRRVVKKFRATQSKQVMENQRRREMGLPSVQEMNAAIAFESGEISVMPDFDADGNEIIVSSVVRPEDETLLDGYTDEQVEVMNAERTLDTLLDGVTDDNAHGEILTGAPVGNEAI